MSTWQDAWFAHISGDSAITAVLGTNPTRLTPVRNPPGMGYPRGTYREVTALPENSLAGWSGTDHVRLQVDIYAKTRDEAVAIKNLIRSRMEQTNSAFKSTVVTDVDGPVENGQEVYRRLLEFNLWTL